jgi:hypothetical protein
VYLRLNNKLAGHRSLLFRPLFRCVDVWPDDSCIAMGNRAIVVPRLDLCGVISLLFF